MAEPLRPAQKFTRPLLALLVAFSAFLVVLGYRFGVNDQNEYLPQLYRVLDPRYLLHDWFTLETVGLNPRTAFIAVAGGATWLIGDAPAHLVLYAVCFGVLGLGVIRLGARLFGSRAAGVLGLAFVLFGSRATLGEQDVLGNYLQQSMLAATGLVWALAMAFERRWRVAWLLVGITTAIHLTTGIIGAVLLGVLTATQLRQIRPKRLLKCAAAFLVPVLAAVVPVLVSLQSQSGGVSGAEFIDILGRIRAPWHYIPSSFPLADYVRVGLVLVAAAAALQLQPPSPHRRALYAVAATIGVLCLVAYVFVELVPVASVMSLSLMRATVFLRLLAMLALGGTACAGLRRREAAPVLAAAAIALGVVIRADLVVTLVAILWLVAHARPRLSAGATGVSAVVVGAALVVAVATILRPSWGQAVAATFGSSYVHVGVGSILAAVALGLYVLWLHGGVRWQVRLRRAGPALWLVPVAVVLLAVFDAPLAERFPGIHDLTVARLQPGIVYEGELDRLAAWCRANTPEEAVFIIPPGSREHAMQDFRVKARRAIVVDFKAIAFTRAGLREWRERIRALTNDAEFAPRGDRQRELAEGYASLTPGDFRRLADIYNASYILVEKPKNLPFELVQESAALRLYRLEQ